MTSPFRRIFGARETDGTQDTPDLADEVGLYAHVQPHEIYMAEDFSPTPSGRVDNDGQYNGTRFREEYLVPALKNGSAILHLEGVAPCAASFVEEAFAPLVTKHEFTPDYLRKHLTLSVDADQLHADTVALAFYYIDNAICVFHSKVTSDFS